MTSPDVPLGRGRNALRWLSGTHTGREFRAGYTWLFLSTPLSLFGLVSILLMLFLGLWLVALMIGLVILAGALRYARLLGGAHRRLARRLLRVTVPAPRNPELKPGLWSWVKARVGDRAGWRAIGYLVVHVPLSLIELAAVAMFTAYGLSAVCYSFLWFPFSDQRMPTFSIYAKTWPVALIWSLTGLVALLLLPRLMHGIVLLEGLLVTALLGHHDLSERVRDLEESRATAVEDSALRLRRIERDLHDGAQAQLVALAMKLGLAKDELNAEELDTAQVRDLVAAAHTNAKQALTELRDLARGIHPAALDAGLDVALSTLVASSGIDADVGVGLPRRPPPSVETIVYFSAAELLTNAAKHAKATVVVEVTEDQDVLRLTVTDHGTGGARIVPGGGLAGVAERLRTVDGELVVDSPPGGPTTVTCMIPVAR